MKLTFCGANLEVTGSCHLLETAGRKFLVDCGMFQGGHFAEDRNWNAFPFDPAMIEAVILTHAHLDHCGRLPRLVKVGFIGPIYTNPATADLARLVLLDAVDVMRYNEKKSGIPLLFDEGDVEETVRRFRRVDYNQDTSLGDGVFFAFKDAGHILGSAFIKVHAEDKVIVFSGDVGNSHVPIVKETKPLGEVDYLIMESTYGSIIHEDPQNRIYLLQEIIIQTIKNRGVLMIPSFSLERTQELLYELDNLVTNKLIPPVPIFLDSPMASSATNIYKDYPQYFDEAAQYLIGRGDDFFKFAGLKITNSVDESKAINDVASPKIIIAGAGMMNGGRILHHLLRYLPDPRSTLLIISFQAEGTLGRHLYNREKYVRIYGQEVEVKAKIDAIGSYSAHADQNKLVEWVKSAKTLPKKIYLVHGESDSMKDLEKRLKKDLGVKVVTTHMGLEVKF